ncbi:MAG TPA: hypothetical protein VF503_25615 [Sphingobium sp.]|uniref:hypothetical protein n=1 Tax=Sphingobium sp. TaxID=1912891 RepID=UPI002ED42986
MSDGDISLEAARERAAAARTELRSAIDDTLGWLSPSRLKAEAAQVASHQIDGVKTALRRSVTGHPLIAWSGLAFTVTALTYLLRRPATALVRTGTDAARTLYQRFSSRK